MTSLPHWYIQKNLGDVQALVDAVDRAGFVRTLLTVVPFENKIHPIASRESVLYGATNFINNAHNAGQPTFFDRDNFTYRAYLNHWGRLMVNCDARIMTFEAFKNEVHGSEEKFFVRPNADDKAFAGTVLYANELVEWYDRISHGGFTITPDIEIVVAEPKPIIDEWRVWLVEGTCVASSSYRFNQRFDTKADVWPIAVEIAESAAKKWSPATVFVVDVGRYWDSTNTNMGIIEAGCFNSAGFYNADLDKIVGAVSAHVRKAP